MLTVRVPEKLYERLWAEAADKGMGLSTYLRERLEFQEGRTRDDIAEIRNLLRELASKGPSPQASESPSKEDFQKLMGMVLEVLLSMRKARVGDVRATVAEVERHKLPAWRG